MSLSGGAPREVLNEVYDADISPDGEQFAVVVQDGDQQVLQYPIGKELYRSRGWIGQPRISPDGKRVAFVDHRLWADDLGEVKLADADGKIVPVVPEHQYMQGVAWSPDGKEIWFSGAEDPGGGLLGKATPGGPVRNIQRTPTLLRVQDIAADGRLLVLSDASRVLIAGKLAGDTSERVYLASPNESASAISEDGTIYAGSNGDVVIDGEYAVFVRRSGKFPDPARPRRRRRDDVGWEARLLDRVSPASARC